MHSPRTILVVCPVCEKRGEIQIPEQVIQENKNTSTILVRAGITCPHTYQVFIDRKCIVRGEQPPDYEEPVAEQSKNPSFTFAAQDFHPPATMPHKPVIPAKLDPFIRAAIRDFLGEIDTLPSPSTCAKGIAGLHDLIQSQQGFHFILPDMKNWANNLRIGAIWDEKAKERVKKRVRIWL